MLVSKGISDSITKLVKSLATTQRLEKMFGRLLDVEEKFMQEISCTFVYQVADIFNTKDMAFTRSSTKHEKCWFLKEFQILLQS